MTNITRRAVLAAMSSGFILSNGAARAAGSLRDRGFFAHHQLPIGIQLYSVGDDMRSHQEATLGALDAIGFRTVETAGFMGQTAAVFRQSLDRAGLKCASAHVAARSRGNDPGLSGDLCALAADIHTLGASHIVMPMPDIPSRMPPPPAAGGDFPAWIKSVFTEFTADDWKANADFLNAKGKALKAQGLQLAYHNHNMEFAPIGASTGLELLLSHTDPAYVQFEMDTGWVAAAGHDPITLLRKHPGRFHLMHMKDIANGSNPNFALAQAPAVIGSGSIDWPRLLPVAYAAGVRTYFVEHEAPFTRSPLETVRLDFNYLNNL
jgi:sugar phosphate isomerase/epimerase